MMQADKELLQGWRESASLAPTPSPPVTALGPPVPSSFISSLLPLPPSVPSVCFLSTSGPNMEAKKNYEGGEETQGAGEGGAQGPGAQGPCQSPHGQ